MSSNLKLNTYLAFTSFCFVCKYYLNSIEYFSVTCCHTISRKLHGPSITPFLRVRTSSMCVLFVEGKLNLQICCGIIFTPSSMNICQFVQYKLRHIQRTLYLKSIFPCKIKINGLKMYH
jgi:hypothetical protein